MIRTAVQLRAAPPLFPSFHNTLIFIYVKITKEQIKDLIKGIVSEEMPTPPKTPDNNFFSDMDAANDSHRKNREDQQPIEYAVRVTLDHNHDGDQIKAEALIWDASLDMSESNHLKVELERIVEKFIKDKNRNGRKIR